jgi:hypothetical protein
MVISIGILVSGSVLPRARGLVATALAVESKPLGQTKDWE